MRPFPVVLIAFFPLLSHAAGWNQANDPELIIKRATGNFVRNIHSLPSSGKLNKVPWPDTYWPNFKFGVADRFNQDKNRPLSVNRTGARGEKIKVTEGFTKAELSRFTQDELRCLSPAEKLDVLNCDYNYPLYQREKKTYSARDPEWEGKCHGWAPAALHYEEPGKCLAQNADGIILPMTSSDIKGLLTFNYAHNNQTNLATICGKRSGRLAGMFRFLGVKDNDINPGSFHLILGNLIGKAKVGFVFDVDSGNEVWNQPMYGYEIVSLQPLSGNGAIREYAVEMDVLYIAEIEGPSAEPQLGGPLERINTNPDNEKDGFIIKKRYQYILEADDKGNILGGRWQGKSIKDHPDMIWIQNAPAFKGQFKILEKIYKDSLN